MRCSPCTFCAICTGFFCCWLFMLSASTQIRFEAFFMVREDSSIDFQLKKCIPTYKRASAHGMAAFFEGMLALPDFPIS